MTCGADRHQDIMVTVFGVTDTVLPTFEFRTIVFTNETVRYVQFVFNKDIQVK